MKRLLTAVLLVPPVLYVIFWGHPWLFFAVVVLVAVICFREYCGIAEAFGFGEMGPIGYAAGLLLLSWNEEPILMITGFALILMAVSMRLDLRQAGPNAALLFFGIIYIFGCWKFAIYLRQRSAHWLMYALALNWVGDAAAYYIGRGFGRHRLAPEVSPKKSWEGSAASIAGSMLFGVVYLHFALPSVPWFVALPLSAVVNVAGQVGDLAESALKRGAEVKDSGTLLPGHGGLLDRVDSSLFAMPVVYAFLRLLE